MTPDTPKTCFKCGVEQTRSDFYKHPEMADGLIGKCKTCTRRDVTRNRWENLDRIRAYDRARRKKPARPRLTSEALRMRKAATTAATNAFRDGRLVKSDSCSVCDVRGVVIHAHHDDYSKPLDVRYLCRRCHAQADKERRAKELADVKTWSLAPC